MEHARQVQRSLGMSGLSSPLWTAPMGFAFPLYAALAGGGTLAGGAALVNAAEPNIRDVWADQVRTGYNKNIDPVVNALIGGQ